MSQTIEDYALIGDCHTAALVGRNGSIDWLCLPRFDSAACFAALLGTSNHGRWLLCPANDNVRSIARRYREGTLILETDYETADGAVTIVDCMPPRADAPSLARLVIGRRGRVPMRMQLVVRFDYGSIIPWVRRTNTGISAVAGPDSLLIDTEVKLRGENLTTVADFTVAAGQRVPMVLTWHLGHESSPKAGQAENMIEETERWWQDWSERCTYHGPWRDAVLRSLITLKGLSYAPTGGIVAAPTTSLPEKIGGIRNWDYRFCWVRDATFTLYALINGGYVDEAKAWREWLVRAVAGTPSQMNIMYGLAGERRLTELELDWLPGYENSRPVRIGNGAYQQFQLDVYGEVMDTLEFARRAGLPADDNAWHVQEAMLAHLESAWREPDDGIWEVRGPPRHFTHSKVMAWTAMDRAIAAVDRLHVAGPLDRWRQLRDEIHVEVCRKGFDPDRNTFVQFYGSKELDASLLMIPLVGFLPADDPRVKGTIEAVQRELMRDGFVTRYVTKEDVEGLPPGEGVFLACTFWLADCLAMLGRRDEAQRIFEQLLSLRNDVGLLSEEYDPVARRLLGNFPQALSHVSLINTACNLSGQGTRERREKR
ncbi:MAG: glycoside hydrolase family 15 protein [Planctomycetaceae bacterium]|nr:glycoside hydrolase family 15 protein [Planctomycetaceae bacterium]